MKNDTIEDTNVSAVARLRTPRELKRELPLGDAARATVSRARRDLRDLLHGRDRERLAVIVGPCSIHDPGAALEYARRLLDVADQHEDSLVVVMRAYFEKPRTTVGWKGLVNDPDLDGSCDVDRGLALARRVLLDINEMGMPCGTEILDPITPQYLGDAVAWGAIGARTTESQTHREMASGLSMPVGFKNGTDGGLDVALQAMISAGHPHAFLGIDPDGAAAVVRTRGNPDRHVVLRGGSGGTNYGRQDIARAAGRVAAQTPGRGIARSVMVDCSHGNSSKDHRRQGLVAREVADTFATGEESVLGLLLESNLAEGRQDWTAGSLRHGVSITDACIGWEETEDLLVELAAMVRTKWRRRACA
ncbi:MAG: 3-deoxy-7-phosphoheptulonate synthase [Candidatus Binatia bacterium]